MSELMTTAEAAAYYGVSTSTIRQWAKSRSVPCMRINSRVLRFPRPEAAEPPPAVDQYQLLGARIIAALQRAGYPDGASLDGIDDWMLLDIPGIGKSAIAKMQETSLGIVWHYTQDDDGAWRDIVGKEIDETRHADDAG